MNILIEGAPERYQVYLPEFVPLDRLSLTFCPLGSTNRERLALCPDAEVFLADAVSTVDGDLIRRMPKLKMIHSEGVAFNGIDLSAARERGVFVCNNQGCNAGAVAEQAIFLMLSLLRRGIPGDRAVREGRQIQMKEQAMVEGRTGGVQNRPDRLWAHRKGHGAAAGTLRMRAFLRFRPQKRSGNGKSLFRDLSPARRTACSLRHCQPPRGRHAANTWHGKRRLPLPDEKRLLSD